MRNPEGVDTVTAEQLEALRSFARGGSSLDELVTALGGLLSVGESQPGNRRFAMAPMAVNLVQVDASSVDWVIEKYLRGKISGETLSTWAGAVLAMNAFELPDDDVVLGLLHDLAMPKRTEDLDRLRIALRREEMRKHFGRSQDGS